jgi:Asp/Glu/hydantoin racemase
MFRVLIVGPTSVGREEIRDEVQADLDRLRSSDVDVSYRCTGAGPAHVRTTADVAAAAPHVVRTVVDAEREGFHAVIIDCTDDPGVGAARDLVAIPVVGAGEALRAAIAGSPTPVVAFSGEELRSVPLHELIERSSGARTIALGATGCSHLAPTFSVIDSVEVVVDPLDAALRRCRQLLGADQFKPNV